MSIKKKRIIHYSLGKFIIGISDGNIFYEKGYGEKIDKTLILTNYEIYYLFKKKWCQIHYDEKELEEKELIKIFEKKEKDFLRNYIVYSELKNLGYIIKSGLKFGCLFRIYEKGELPGTQHSKWLLEIFSDNERIKINTFIAKSRIANSTKKKILTAIVDNDNKTSYYETQWINPKI